MSSRAEFVGKTKRAADLPSTTRVYRKEWVFDSRWMTPDAADQYARERYRDRVRDEDVERRVDEGRLKAHAVWVRLWNMAGEYKHSEDADAKAQELRDQGFEVEVVPRNSRSEHRLRNYGVGKLPRVP